MRTLDIVVPCYNEESNLRQLCAALHGALDSEPIQWKLILVDDGSRDRTAAVISSLASEDDHVRGLIFSRNFGKEAAMFAGLEATSADYVVLMDADLQHPPHLIPALMAKAIETQAGQVVARRDRTGESKLRALVSGLYYRMVNHLVEGVQLENGVGDFRVLSRQAVDTLLRLPERTRFSKGLFSWIGFPTEEVFYQNEARFAGESKWSFRSLLNYGIDGVVSFSTRPLRVMAHLGWVMALLGLLYLVALLIGWAVNGVTAPGYITTIAAIVVFSGIQLLALGVLGEYVGNIYQEVKARPHYVVMQDTEK